MKVKIFTDYDENIVCGKVNDWSRENGINIINIRYSTLADAYGQCFYTILVMYKDK